MTVDGDRAYVLDNRGVVLCLDVRGMANGNDGPFRDEAAYMTPRKGTTSSAVGRSRACASNWRKPRTPLSGK